MFLFKDCYLLSKMTVFSEKKELEVQVSDRDTFSSHSVMYQLIRVSLSFGGCHLLLERGRDFFPPYQYG